MIWPIAIGMTLFSFELSRAHSNIIKSLAVKVPPEAVVEGPLVSVIIPAFNEERYLPATLEALGNQTYSPIEIIVVDDGSTDATAEIARSYGATVVPNDSGGIPNATRNAGYAHAQGDYLLFLDADTVLQMDAVENFVAALMERSDVVYPNKTSTDDQAFGAIRLLLGWADLGGFTSAGMCIATRRDVLETTNGWDESLNPMETRKEDGIELCKKAVSLGYKLEQLKTIYAATSDRRHHGQGLGDKYLWTKRSVRDDATDLAIKGTL